MRTTSTTIARRIAGLVALPALLLAAACGGDDDGGGDSAAFCDQVRDIDEQMTDTELDNESIGDIADAMAAVDPPGDIAEDWATMADGFDRMRDIDLTEPEGFDESEFEDAGAASDRVADYVDEECGFSIDD